MRKAAAIFFLSLLFFSLSISLVYARGLVPCGGCAVDYKEEKDTKDPTKTRVVCPQYEPDCSLCYLFVMFDNIIDFLLFYIVPPLAALMIAIGGGMYIFAFGRPEMISRAKSLFTAVAIGLLIIYGAWVFVNTFLTVIGATKWQGFGQGWWIIECE